MFSCTAIISIATFPITIKINKFHHTNTHAHALTQSLPASSSSSSIHHDSLRVLEWDKLSDLVASFATTSLGREAVKVCFATWLITWLFFFFFAHCLSCLFVIYGWWRGRHSFGLWIRLLMVVSDFSLKPMLPLKCISMEVVDLILDMLMLPWLVHKLNSYVLNISWTFSGD